MFLTKNILKSFLIIFIVVLNIIFLYASEITIIPTSANLSCPNTYNFDIVLNTRGHRVIAADIKFFLEWFDLLAYNNLWWFDNVFYVGTGISTKWSNVNKVYHYINTYQNSFWNYVSGTNINVARIILSPKTWYNIWSIKFYNLSSNDEDSNISVWLEYGLNSMPINYWDIFLDSIDWSYTFLYCSGANNTGTNSTGSFNWWGGWWGLTKDVCELWDNSSSYYDNECEEYHGSADICGVNDSDYSNELKWAYLYAYRYWVTTICPIQEAELDWYLYRNHFAKMISEFAVNVLWDEPEIDKQWCDNYNDIKWDTQELRNFIKTACELWLMWLHADGDTPMRSFNPQGIVTRAEFGTVFSRLLFGDRYNVKNYTWEDTNTYWYENHLNALKKYGIMTKIDGDWPSYLEKRWWVMLMMQRADLYWIFMWKLPALNWIKALFE
jgi:hypothetical protein